MTEGEHDHRRLTWKEQISRFFGLSTVLIIILLYLFGGCPMLADGAGPPSPSGGSPCEGSPCHGSPCGGSPGTCKEAGAP